MPDRQKTSRHRLSRSSKLKVMYTRCPQCQTTFTVSPEQLQARGGVVRCGACHNVFHADRNLMQELPQSSPTTSRNQQPLAAVGGGANIPLPTVDELLGRKPRSRTRTLFWVLGNLALLIVLTAQVLYFYYDRLAQNQSLRPSIMRLCEYFGCRVSPLTDVGNIELAKTFVRPHPTYQQALRIRATLINRASFPQPFPLMEVTLTNSKGELVARKTFRPEQYVKNYNKTSGLMPTNVAMQASLHVTNPQNEARNYEILLVTNH